MKIDISRDSHLPTRTDFSRVLALQGRALLDADLNEQTSLLLGYVRTLVTDLVGPFWATTADGLRISVPASADDVLQIEPGRMYVDGIPVTLDKAVSYADQPLPVDAPLPSGAGLLIYLDVWERPVTCAEIDTLADPALNDVDTSARAQVVWQVRIHPDKAVAFAPADFKAGAAGGPQKWTDFISGLQLPDNDDKRHRGRLSVHTTDTTAESRNGGTANQLYRVEIHSVGTPPAGGKKLKKAGSAAAETATFKWSRDNGSVVYVVDMEVTRDDIDNANDAVWITLADFGPDSGSAPKAGDLLEPFSARHPDGVGTKLLKVIDVDPTSSSIRVDGEIAERLWAGERLMLRRWDHADARGGLNENNAIDLHEGADVPLEDGIVLHFEPGGVYRPGDYWLVPVRSSVDNDNGSTLPAEFVKRPPDGIQHHYAPLATIMLAGNVASQPVSLRRIVTGGFGDVV